PYVVPPSRNQCCGLMRKSLCGTRSGQRWRSAIITARCRREVSATPKAGQPDDMARSDFYLVERPDPKYGAAHLALRQIRRQGRIRQSLLPESTRRWASSAVG